MCEITIFLFVHKFEMQILLHFGTQSENEEGAVPYPVMNKLNQRMSKVNDRKKK